MTTFNDKEKATENKYAHDKETEFKVHARAHKLLGLWAAGKMGMNGATAEDYAKSLVLAERGHLFNKVKTDLLAHDVHMSDHNLKTEMHRLEQLAKEQVG